MKVAIYARVSTKEQTTDNQLEQLRHLCRQRGHAQVKEYIDTVSGAKDEKKRPAFAQMMQDARKRKFQLLLFWSLDRFSREGVIKSLMYLEELSQAGVEYYSMQESYLNTLGPFSHVVVSLVATFAKMERDRLIERVKAGLERAAKAGRKGGRPKAQAQTVNQIRNLKAAGLSDRQIGQQLAISHRTVAKYLHDQPGAIGADVQPAVQHPTT